MLFFAKEDLEWRFEAMPAPYIVFVIALGIVAFVVTAYLLEPKGDGRSRLGRIFLAALRAASLLLATLILFRPVERRETRETKDGHVIVVIDKSRSMSLKDREGDERYRLELSQAIGCPLAELNNLDRLSRVKKALANSKNRILEQLAEKNKVKLYTFDASRNRLADVAKLEEKAQEKPPEKDKDGTPALSPEVTLMRAQAEVANIEADGPATALGESLQKILTDMRTEKVAGVILLTDGRSNAGSLSAEVVAGRYGKKGIPIYAVGIGDPNAPKDLSVESLEAPDVTIAGDIVNFETLLRAQGYDKPRDVRVELVFDGVVVKSETVQLGGDKTELPKRLQFKPEKEGEFNVEVRIPPDENEITVENNKAIHHIRVIASRIKVLYVEGPARWEYRYLKNALVRDPKIEAQCLLLDADAEWPQEASRGVQPLRSFPSREQLFQYHVIVFGDVNPAATGWDQRPVFPEGALESIKEFVADQGGGFLMISGEQSSPRRYSNTPIAQLLPIVIDENEGASAKNWDELFRPRITREGQRSPLLKLEPDEEKNRTLWQGANALPGFYWYSRALKAKPLARVIAEHPADANANGNYPIWAWQYFKSGTVFWSAVDETWRWRAGADDKYMYRFWGQVLRFLAHGRFQRSKRFLVTTDKSNYTVGEEVRIGARVSDRKYQPSTEKTQEVIVERPDGQTEKLELKFIEGQPGKYEGRYKPIKVGRFKVSIDPGTTGSEGEVAARLFQVKLPSIELEEPRMDAATLEAVAKQSGGEFLRLEKLGDLPGKIAPMTESVPASATQRELWDNPSMLLVFILLLAVEWIGRKIARLL